MIITDEKVLKSVGGYEEEILPELEEQTIPESYVYHSPGRKFRVINEGRVRFEIGIIPNFSLALLILGPDTYMITGTSTSFDAILIKSG